MSEGPPRRPRRDALLVLLVALASHWGIVRGTEFTYDDLPIVRDNPRLVLREASDLSELLTGKYWGAAYPGERLWRPVPLLSFAADRALHGANPDGYRWTSIALHALCCLAVWGLFRRLLPGRSLALAGALLFATQPVHAEATAGVVGRSEVLGLLLALVGMHLHFAARESRALWSNAFELSGAALAFFLAFASKEIALTAPFVLGLLEATRRGPELPRGWGARLLPYGVYGGTLLAYGVCRWQALAGSLIAEESARTLGSLPFLTRLGVAAEVARDSLGACLVPLRTSAHYPFTPPEPGGVLALTVVGHLALLGLAAWALRRRLPHTRALGAGLLGFYLSLGPVSNLIPIGVVRADRLLYTPSLYAVLAALAAVGLLRRALQARLGRGAPRLLFLVALAGALFAYQVQLSENARAWTQRESLWRTSLARFPDEPRALLALGDALRARPGRDPAREAEARQCYARAVQGFVPPERWAKQAARARRGLAVCVQDADPPRAEALLLEAVRLDPASTQVALALADLYLAQAAASPTPGQRRRALRLAEQRLVAVLGGAAHDYELWLRLGTVLSHLEQRDQEAEAAFTRASECRADPWQARFNRARLRRLGLGNLPGALDDYRAVSEILQARPPERLGPAARGLLHEALFFRGALALKLGRPAEAIAALDALSRLAPGYRTREVQGLLSVVRRG